MAAAAKRDLMSFKWALNSFEDDNSRGKRVQRGPSGIAISLPKSHLVTNLHFNQIFFKLKNILKVPVSIFFVLGKSCKHQPNIYLKLQQT